MSSHIVFDPVVPFWVLGAACILALIVGVFFLWRNPRSAIFRIGALCALIGVIANPQLQTDETTTLNDIVLVLKDTSSSQTLDNREEISAQILEMLKARSLQTGDLDIIEADIRGEQETLILERLKETIADIPRNQLAAVFIISDGQATDIPLSEDGLGIINSPDALVPSNVPVHVLLTGRDDEVDRRIIMNSAPRYGIVRESVRVSFRIEDLRPDNEPSPSVENVFVSLKVDGDEILRQSVPTNQNVGFDVPLNRPGKVIIELTAEGLPEELSQDNNTVVLPITAVRDRLRVLLISGEPNPGERVWRNLLKSDPSIDVVHFTILRTADKFDTAAPNELALIPFPTNELFIEKLKEFDLIIFDRYTWRNVLKSYHFDNIARFVEEGGAMLVASGPEYNGRLSLARRRTISYLLPSTPLTGTIDQPFRPSLTDEGHKHPVTANLPDQQFWGRWIRAIPTQIRSGISLMTGPADVPILILDRVGEGRVGMIQSDHIWLWARGFDGGGPHAELLRRTAHWLMKEPQLEEERLSLVANGSSLTIERRSLNDAAIPTTVTLPNGEQRIIEMEAISPGIFQAIIPDLPAGLYRATSDELFAIGAIGLSNAPEQENIVSESRKLSPLAHDTGGEVFRVRRDTDTIRLPAIRRLRSGINPSVTKSGPGWAGILRNNVSQLDGRRNTALLSPWLWLGLIAVMLGLAWFIESRTVGKGSSNTK